MWPRRGCVIGGAPSSTNYGGDLASGGALAWPSNIPTKRLAKCIWRPEEAAFYLNNLYFGTEWPTLPDPNYSSVHVNLHFNWKGTSNGNLRMIYPDVGATEVDGQSGTLTVATRGIGNWPHRIASQYSLKDWSVAHNVNSNLTLGAGDLTLEGWFYCTNTGVQNSIWDWRGNSTSNVQPLIYLNGAAPNVGHLTYNRGGTGDIIIDPVVAPSNVWTHFALCRSSGTMYLYKNGVSVGSAADASNFVSNNTIRIGLNVPITVRFNGYLSEFRETAGVARYPGGTTFTVPTPPFPDY